MQINEIKENNLKEALSLVRVVFDEFIGHAFSKKGRNEFYKYISHQNILEKYNEDRLVFYGYYVNDTIVGVIALRDGSHISLLFVDKQYQGKGIAKALFEEIEIICKDNPNIYKLSVNSSPYAIDFYRKIGFKAIDKEKYRNGIRFTPMEYYI